MVFVKLKTADNELSYRMTIDAPISLESLREKAAATIAESRPLRRRGRVPVEPETWELRSNFVPLDSNMPVKQYLPKTEQEINIIDRHEIKCVKGNVVLVQVLESDQRKVLVDGIDQSHFDLAQIADNLVLELIVRLKPKDDLVAEQPSTSIQLMVVFQDENQTTSFTEEKTMTVQEFKRKLMSEFGLSKLHRVKLDYGSVSLENDQTLGSLTIKANKVPVLALYENKQQGFQIFCKTLTGKICTLNDICTETTVLEVKEMIQAKEAIPPVQQRLMFGGIQLQDQATVSEYGIGKESTVRVVMRLRGGMFHASSGMIGYQPASETSNKIKLPISYTSSFEPSPTLLPIFEVNGEEPVGAVAILAEKASKEAEAKAAEERKARDREQRLGRIEYLTNELNELRAREAQEIRERQVEDAVEPEVKEVQTADGGEEKVGDRKRLKRKRGEDDEDEEKEPRYNFRARRS